jgi:hypothetical protein
MAVFSPRSRMISVRLSEDEYTALRQLCSVTGARSVSALTRDAMRVFLNSTSNRNILVNRADEFREQMALLHKKIEDLAERISSSETKPRS